MYNRHEAETQRKLNGIHSPIPTAMSLSAPGPVAVASRARYQTDTTQEDFQMWTYRELAPLAVPAFLAAALSERGPPVTVTVLAVVIT